MLPLPEYVKIFIGLMALAPPLVVLPAYLTLVSNQTLEGKKRVALVAPIAFCLTLLVFTFIGNAILDRLGITIAGFRIAGGILLLLTALDMMRSNPGKGLADDDDVLDATSLGIVPLAIPIMAGPGTISTTIIFASMDESLIHRLMVGGVIVFLALIIYISFRVTLVTGRFYGKTAIAVSNRIMGLLIAAIGVEFMLSGLAAYFPNLLTVDLWTP